jgi:hypothetical protein
MDDGVRMLIRGSRMSESIADVEASWLLISNTVRPGSVELERGLRLCLRGPRTTHVKGDQERTDVDGIAISEPNR